MSEIEKIVEFAKNELKISLNNTQIAQFNGFLRLFLETNSHMNLSSFNDEKSIIKKHFIDSIYSAKWVDFANKKIVDLGSGGGFPAIPLAILFPNARFTLIDSTTKKCLFLEKVINELELKNVRVLNKRIEELDDQLRDQFDLVTARALKELRILLELSIPYLKVGGLFLSYKGAHAKAEIKDASQAFVKLKCSLIDSFEYSLSNYDDFRALLLIRKDSMTPTKYPRSYPTILKKPL